MQLKNRFETTNGSGADIITPILMNQNVIDYLGPNNTVQDLLNLANAVLGGSLEAGVAGVPSHSDIYAALNAINDHLMKAGVNWIIT